MTTITTWTDLADELTADQRDRLEAADMPAADLLDLAQHWADVNRIQTDLAGVPAPAGAIRCSSWFRDGDQPTRAAYGRSWRVGGTSIELSCDQAADGSIGPWCVEVALDQGFTELGQVQARDLADALTEAADELDRLSGNPWPVDSTFHRCCGGIGRHVNCAASIDHTTTGGN